MAARDVVSTLGRTRLALAALLSSLGVVAVVAGRFTSTHPSAVFRAFLEGRYPYLSLFFGAMFLVHVVTLNGARRRTLLYAAVVAEWPTILEDVFDRPPLYPFCFGLGSVAFAYRLLLWYRSRDEERASHARALFDSVVPAYFGLISPVFLSCTVVFLPAVADLRVQHAFGSFGAAPPVLVARLFQSLPALDRVCTLVYAALPVGIAIIHAVRLSQGRQEPPRLLAAFTLIALFGYLLYFAFPMVGPREAWAALDARAVFPPAVVPFAEDTWLTVHGRAPRNCMPSLHTSWALSAFLACRGRGSRRLHAFGMVWLACTVLATLGLGEHWLIDLVVAFPFAFAVDALSLPGELRTRDAARIGALVLMVAGWYVVLLAGLHAIATAPVFTAAAMAITVVVSIRLGLSLTLNAVSPGQPDERRVPAFVESAAGPLST